MSPALSRVMAILAIAIPIVWPWIAAAMSEMTRAWACFGPLILACAWGAAIGAPGWLALHMGMGALVALVCRYPKHGGNEAHRASVAPYEDMAFSAGLYGVLTCICKSLFI